MKKLLNIITVAVAAVTLFAASASAKNPERLVILGDSITSGYGLDGYILGDNSSAKNSFANLLAAEYGLSDGYQNFAVDGRTTDELLEAMGDEDIVSAVEQADAIVVSIGGNDFLRVFFSIVEASAIENADSFAQLGINADLTTSSGVMLALEQALELDTDGAFLRKIAATFAEPETAMQLTAAAKNATSNIVQILSKITGTNHSARTYILTIYNPFENLEGYESISSLADLVLTSVNSGMATTSQNMRDYGYGVYVIDVAEAFKGKANELTNILSLDIHPNASGHMEIYNAISSAISASNVPTYDEITDGSDATPDNSTSTDSAAKGSPDTGIEGFAAIGGIALPAAGILLISRKKSR